MKYDFIKAPEPNGKIRAGILSGLSDLGLESVTTSINSETKQGVVLIEHSRKGDSTLILTNFSVDRASGTIYHRLVARRTFRSGKGRLVLKTVEFWRIDVDPKELSELGNQIRSGGGREQLEWGSPDLIERIDGDFVTAYLDWVYSETG